MTKYSLFNLPFFPAEATGTPLSLSVPGHGMDAGVQVQLNYSDTVIVEKDEENHKLL